MKDIEYINVLKTEQHIIERGYVNQEDLTQIAEHRHYIFEALAKQKNITTREVRDFIEQSKISALDYFQAITAHKLRVRYYGFPTSITGHILEF